MPYRRISPCTLSTRTMPFQLCTQCSPRSENPGGRADTRPGAERPCPSAGKTTAATRPCYYKIRV